MSEQDNIFDIDAYFKEKKAPASIKTAWNEHLRYFNQCEAAALKWSEMVGALKDLKRLWFGK